MDIQQHAFDYLKLALGIFILAALVGWCATERQKNAHAPVITKGGLVVDDNELGRLNQ